MAESEETAFRKRGIADCLQWLCTLNNNNEEEGEAWVAKLRENVQFEPDKSLNTESGGMGIFCKRELKKGDIIFTISSNAGLTLVHSLLSETKSPVIQAFVKDCDAALTTLIASMKDQVSPHDRYSKVNGRVLLKTYLHLTFVITIMLCCRDTPDESPGLLQLTPELSSEISQAYGFWRPFLDTLPHDWSHLPLMWTEDELDMMKGTSFQALALRFQNEMKEVFHSVFLPTLAMPTYNVSANQTDAPDVDKSFKDSEALYARFKLALAMVNSHAHSIGGASQTSGRFVEPTPIVLPIIDLANGTRNEKDSNAELVGFGSQSDGFYHLQATRDCSKGEELFICYGENTLSNLDFFIKFGYIPLRNGSPVVVTQDFVTLSIPSSSRPQCEVESTRLSKLDQLRWKELARNGLGKDRLVEPIPYFQRPFYLTGDVQAIRNLRQTGIQEDIENPMISRLEQFVFKMLANQKQLKKLDEGKTPPPPTLELWEPGECIIRIVDHYLEKQTNILSSSATTAAANQTVQEILANQARTVERELVLMWRHTIACHYGLYATDKIVRLPSQTLCCVQCRTTLGINACATCQSVYYCSDLCRQDDWRNGHSRICAMIAQSKGLR